MVVGVRPSRALAAPAACVAGALAGRSGAGSPAAAPSSPPSSPAVTTTTPPASPSATASAVSAPTPTPVRRPTPSPTRTAPRAERYVYPVQRCRSTYSTSHHDYPASDIFTQKGCAFVAVTSGRVDEVSFTDRWDPQVDSGASRGGRSVSVVGDDGVRYYGSHLLRIARGIQPGARVRAGQLLGLIDNSGDAKYTATHVHFGLSWPTRPGVWWVRRGEVWPQRYLAEWRAGRGVSPPAQGRAAERPARPPPPRPSRVLERDEHGLVREVAVAGDELLADDPPAHPLIEAQRTRPGVGPEQRRGAFSSCGHPPRGHEPADAAPLRRGVARHAAQPPRPPLCRCDVTALPRVGEDRRAADEHVVVPGADVHRALVLRVDRVADRTSRTQDRMTQREDLLDRRAPDDERHATSRSCQSSAEVSVSDAIWSTTTRSRAASSGAAVHASRSHGSRTPGAPADSVPASSASTCRSRACTRTASSRRITNRSATALRIAHSARVSTGMTRSPA